MSDYPRGSEWRRWDLQVQTILDDGYVSLAEYATSLKSTTPIRWERYVSKVGGEANALLFDSREYFEDASIEKGMRCRNYSRNFFAFLETFTPELACVGVTDHNYFDDELLDCLWVFSQKANCKLIPGVEINCGGIHMLVLFSRPPCKQISFSAGVKTLLQRWNILTPKNEGVLVVTSKDVKDVIDDAIREEGIVIFPHCNSDNGLFQERGKTDRTHLANIFNHQSVNLLQFQSSRGMAGLAQYIGSNPKLISSFCCHVSSDSRALRDIGCPDSDGNMLWIKADPTFQGLKQILLEPEDRVYVGQSPPINYDQARVIRSVQLSGCNGWFDEVLIPINAGLVSIIGQKGSGKSALAEMIAFAAGSWQGDNQESFLKRSGNHLKSLSVTLEWAEGPSSHAKLGGPQPDTKQVRYLSQRFVEHLCSEDHVGGDLTREIESVIFSYIEPSDTLNASSFEELRAIRTQASVEEGDRIKSTVQSLIREEWELRENSAKLPEKKERLKSLADERDGLIKQLPKPASAEEERVQKELLESRSKLADLQQAAAVDKQKLQTIANIRTRVTAFRANAARFFVEIGELLTSVDVPEVERELFRPQFPADTEGPLTQREATLKAALATRDGSVESPAAGSIGWYQTRIKELLQRDSADKALQQKVKTIQVRTAAIAVEVQRISAEIGRIEGPERIRLQAARTERQKAYVDFFENLKAEEAILEELYAPVRRQLASDPDREQAQRLDFSIRWDVDLNSWLQRGTLLFDQRRTIPHGTMENLGKVASDVLAPAWRSGDPSKIGPAVEAFMVEFRRPDLKPRNYLRSGVTLKDLLSWLYEVDHICLTYGLKYNGADLANLSPGTKGIVLLILYLGMDLRDTRPLIVDQPDENLDNDSIYSLLRTYFKSAKRRRQIILITHNPNLVVNGDSEQVIVASVHYRDNGLPHIGYQSGALEDDFPEPSGIRQHVCRILEGGSDAFQKRERRYALRQRGT